MKKNLRKRTSKKSNVNSYDPLFEKIPPRQNPLNNEERNVSHHWHPWRWLILVIILIIIVGGLAFKHHHDQQALRSQVRTARQASSLPNDVNHYPRVKLKAKVRFFWSDVNASLVHQNEHLNHYFKGNSANPSFKRISRWINTTNDKQKISNKTVTLRNLKLTKRGRNAVARYQIIYDYRVNSRRVHRIYNERTRLNSKAQLLSVSGKLF